MLGSEEDHDQLGVIPRALNELFQYVNSRKEDRVCVVEVSVLEIYNETLRDLGGGIEPDTAGPGTHPHLEIHEGQGGAVAVRNLTKVHMETATETLMLLGAAIDARTVGTTNANHASSRSHLIFAVVLTQTDVGDETASSTVVATLNLVDLAGSERQSKTGATGARLKEGANINRSLSTLGTCPIMHVLFTFLPGPMDLIRVATSFLADGCQADALKPIRYVWWVLSMSERACPEMNPRDN
jgi:hypothetical protein